MVLAMMIAQWADKSDYPDGKKMNKRTVDMACELVYRLETNQIKYLRLALK
jgi:hypothetical protein